MFSISPISIFSFSFGPSVTGVGSLGGHAASSSPGSIGDLTVPWHDLADNPSHFSLLSWHTHISEFTGRTSQMQELHDWASSSQAINIKFITGEGGTGKSRLGAEFAKALKKSKWAAGFVDLREPKSFHLHKKGTLLVVDYPEEHRHGVAKLLENLAKAGTEHKIRVLFLTRQQVEDWEPVVHDNEAMDIVDMKPVSLGDIDPDAAHKLYNSALEKASESFGTVPPPLSKEALSAWLEQEDRNRRALFVLAASVYSAMHPQEEVVSYSGREIIDEIVKREMKRLEDASEAMGADKFALPRLSAMAAIADEIPLVKIKELAANAALDLGLPQDDGLEQALKTSGIYFNGAVRAPKPDIVAAAFMVKALASKKETAGECLWAALENDIKAGLERLSRLIHDAEIVLGIRDNLMSLWLAEAVQGKSNRCKILNDIFNEYGDRLHIGFVSASIAACQTLLRDATDDEERSPLLNNISLRLTAAGDNKGALEAIREAVDIYRRLSEATPADFEPDLAISLNNFSNKLSDAGDNKGALEAIREAVEIERRLSETNPARFEPDLATNLNNLSYNLSVAGDNKGAIIAVRESVEIRRRLSKVNPARFEPDLASSLNNLSNSLTNAEDIKGALKAIQEAVEIYRRLSEANPARFMQYLAISLNNLSNRLYGDEDNKGAPEAIREAVEFYRRLSKANPARFEPDLAQTLNNLSVNLSNAGNNDGALEAIREAVEIRRRFSKAAPARFAPDLAQSLGAYGQVLRTLNRKDEAISAFREGADLLRPFAEKWPGSPFEKP